MKSLIEALFPQGQRKVMVSLIAVVIGVVLEKFGGGLSDNMRDSLIAIVAIFAGGNVVEHLAGALKFLKGTKVGQIVEDVIPGDQGLGEVRGGAVEAATAPDPRDSAIEALSEAANTAEVRMAELEKKVAIQAQNTTQIIQILNAMRGAANGQPAKPQG